MKSARIFSLALLLLLAGKLVAQVTSNLSPGVPFPRNIPICNGHGCSF